MPPNDLLTDTELPDLVRRMTAILDDHGHDVTAAGVEAVRTHAPDAWRGHVPLLLDLVVGTQRADRLGKTTEGWLFTNVAAQQSTHPSIAAYHAQWFDGIDRVVEVCTGAGLDTRALADRCGHVTTFESDAVTASLAVGNLLRAGVANVTVVHETVPGPAYAEAMRTAHGVWADPARRDDAGRRARSGSTYDPPIGLFTTVSDAVRVVGIKVGPGDTLEADVIQRFASTYIGWRDECRERILWRGVETPLAVLVDRHVGWTPSGRLDPPQVTEPSAGMIVVEPHASIIASGSVGPYFSELHANVIDTRIGYGLCATDPGPSAWHRCFRIIDVEQGVDVKRMQRKVRSLGWGSGTEIKKRGVDIVPMSLHRALPFASGGRSGVILLARGPQVRWTIYAERLS